MRKFISLLGAVSIAATSLVAVIPAHAEGDTVLYSNSFNGYETSFRGAGGSVFAGNDNGQYGSVVNDENWQWIFEAPASQTLDKLTVGNASGDDTGVFMINEKDGDESDKYLQARSNRFPHRCKPSITGFDQYTANDGEDLVIAFDMMLGDTNEAINKSILATVEFMSDDTSLGTIDTTVAESGKWVKVKAITSDGKTTIYVDDEAVITDADGAISTIRPKPLGDGTAEVRITGQWFDYPQVNIDELVIMSAADGETAEIPKAEDKTLEDEEPKVTEEPGVEVPAVAKAATKMENGELLINEKTNGAVFRFDVSAFEEIESAKLIIKAAPRSYKESDNRWENAGIDVYRVGSEWNGDSITPDEWNKLSKNDPITTIWSAKDTSPSDATPAFQTLEPYDITEIAQTDDDGILIFAFRTSTAREHAIDVVLEVKGTGDYVPPTPTEPAVTDAPGVDVEAVAKAATKVSGDELIISDGTKGAVFRFDVSGFEGIKKAKLKVEAAPRSYDADNNRWANTEIWTYSVGSNWNGTSSEITEADWNKLSKNDPIDTQYTAVYPDATGEAVAPYQKLNEIDVTSYVADDEDGIVIFAFKTKTGREHAIKAVLEVIADGEPTPTEPVVTEKPGVEVEAAAKAATIVTEDGELRISNGTKGAVYRFDVSDFESIEKAELIVKAAPRSYDEKNTRWANAEINTYSVGSSWNGEGPEITEEDWNKLSKNNPIDKQYTTVYPDGTGEAVAPYQTLNAIDVTEYVADDEDGIVIFAFKATQEREHAIDAVLKVTGKEADKWTVYTATYKDGVLTDVTVEVVEDPAVVEGIDVAGTANEDGTITKKFLWLGMTPYVAPEAPAEPTE